MTLALVVHPRRSDEKKNEFLYEPTVKAGLLYHLEDVPGFSRNCSHCISLPLNIWDAAKQSVHPDIVNAAERDDVVLNQSPTLAIARVMEFDGNPRKTGEKKYPHFDKNLRIQLKS